ncbi:unnamed protein product, partial [Rotaria socialis]
ILIYIHYRGAVNQRSISTPRSSSQTKKTSVHYKPTAPAVNPNFTSTNQSQTHVGSTHNRQPAQHDGHIGNEITNRTGISMNSQFLLTYILIHSIYFR